MLDNSHSSRFETPRVSLTLSPSWPLLPPSTFDAWILLIKLFPPIVQMFQHTLVSSDKEISFTALSLSLLHCHYFQVQPATHHTLTSVFFPSNLHSLVFRFPNSSVHHMEPLLYTFSCLFSVSNASKVAPGAEEWLYLFTSTP